MFLLVNPNEKIGPGALLSITWDKNSELGEKFFAEMVYHLQPPAPGCRLGLNLGNRLWQTVSNPLPRLSQPL